MYLGSGIFLFASERSQVVRVLEFTSGQEVGADSAGQASCFVGCLPGSHPFIKYRLWLCD